MTTGNADVASFQWSPSARQVAFLRADNVYAAEGLNSIRQAGGAFTKYSVK